MNKAKKLFFYIIIIFLFIGCSDRIENDMNEVDIIDRIKNLSTLGTVEYTFSKIIHTSDDQLFTLGERKILMSCKAHVKAGINFENITISKLDKENKTIEIIIPKGEIILINVPAESIKEEYKQIDFFRHEFSSMEIQKLQVIAEKDIKKKVSELRITEDAERNAKIFLEDWIRDFGFKSVKIYVK